MVQDGPVVGQEACNMNFTEQTASFSTVAKRVVSGITDKYVRCGSNVMVRKFDPVVVPTGSYQELWLGFRWRISSSYNFLSGNFQNNPIDPFGEYSTMEFGLCKTAGTVWGQSGSFNASTSLQHTVGYRKTDNGSSGTSYWILSGSSNPFVMASGGGLIAQRIGGALGYFQTNFIGNRIINLFVNTNYFTASYRSVFIMRFRMGTGSFKSEAMFPSFIYPDYSNNTAISTDFTSSALLADLMEASSWASASSVATKFGYTSVDFPDAVPISQSINGFFDGIFFSWRRLFDNMEISDVVVRTI